MSNTKYAFIDVETTGLDETKNDIVQLVCIITDDTQTELDRFSLKWRPPASTEYSQGALDKTGLTVETIEAYPINYLEAHTQFTDFLAKHVNRYDKNDKLIFVAYNAPFDDKFVRSWFNKAGDSYYGSFFWHPALCVMQMSMFFLRNHRPALKSMRLGYLCESAGLGWDESLAHDAAYDIEQTLKLFTWISTKLEKL